MTRLTNQDIKKSLNVISFIGYTKWYVLALLHKVRFSISLCENCSYVTVKWPLLNSLDGNMLLGGDAENQILTSCEREDTPLKSCL